jgi:hypothetical protein
MKEPVYDLDDMLQLAADYAEEILLKRHRKSLVPVWLMISRKGKSFIISAGWKNDKEKYAAEYALRKTMRKWDIVAYSMVTEAWLSVRTPVEGFENLTWPNMRPSQDPARKEVVMALATNGKERRWRQWGIVRDYNERIIKLEPQELISDQMESWMAELLDKEETN